DSADTASSGLATAISPSTVSHLSPLWTASNDFRWMSSPVVANGDVYVGSYGINTGQPPGISGLHVFDAETGARLWIGATSPIGFSTPAVANGIVYVGAQYVQPGQPTFYAFDATGAGTCSGTPRICSPLWTATTGDGIDGSPTVADGLVYITSYDGSL